MTSAVSVHSSVSASTTSLKKSALKKPKKDVSVSFKQMPDTDTEENEQESVKITTYNDDSHEDGEEYDEKEDNTNDQPANDEKNKQEDKKLAEDKETFGNNTQL